MKRIASLLLGLAMAAAALSGCGAQGRETAAQEFPDAVSIVLSDDGIIVDGKAVSTDESAAVHTAHDIVCYESGRDFTYGEGTEADEHTAEEAEAHTVVHITQPGTYALSGTLSAGQIAVDLGEDAEDDPAAVVTLILNGVDITCTVAPAVERAARAPRACPRHSLCRMAGASLTGSHRRRQQKPLRRKDSGAGFPAPPAHIFFLMVLMAPFSSRLT